MLHFALLGLTGATALPAKPLPSAAPSAVSLPAEPARAPHLRGVATTGFLTAGDLQAKCEDKALAMVSYCYAYVTGVHDSVKAYETWLNVREFCRPLRLSQSELRQTFLTYIQNNPAAASGEAASVVVVALRQKYACDTPVGPAPAVPNGPGQAAKK